MLDVGVVLAVKISQKDMNRNPTECLAIEVFAELVLPSQKLIDSLLVENRADDAIDIYRQNGKFS